MQQFPTHSSAWLVKLATCRKCKKQGHYQLVCKSVTNLAIIRTDIVNEEPFLGTIEIISTHSKDNQWMVELLLNGKPVQVKIDTSADVTTISKEIFQKLDGVNLREKSKSLHGPVKQAPANNAWTIHQHADISTIKTCVKRFSQFINQDKLHSGHQGISKCRQRAQ